MSLSQTMSLDAGGTPVENDGTVAFGQISALAIITSLWAKSVRLPHPGLWDPLLLRRALGRLRNDLLEVQQPGIQGAARRFVDRF